MRAWMQASTQRQWQEQLPLLTALLVASLLLITGCGRGAAGQAAPTPTPLAVDFARITQAEPLRLPQGAPFTLLGYTAEAVAIGDLHVVQLVTPTVVSEYAPPATHLLAAASGSTTITITQTLCQGVESCNGPALFLQLQVEVE
jgi:hypothetical protein